MKPTLSVLDPLAAHEVAIHITLPPSDEPRASRPILVSVGSAGQTPLFREGRLAEVAELISDAWADFSARVELQAVQTANDTETATDVGDANGTDDTDDIAVETTAATGLAQPVATPAPDSNTPPQPAKPANLSLF